MIRAMKKSAESIWLRNVGVRTVGGRKVVRAARLAVFAGLALFLLNAEAGNVQFSSTAPAIVDNGEAIGGQQAPVGRGREPAPKMLLKATQDDASAEFAPQPNTIRAVMSPVTEAEAAAHDARVEREIPVGLNANGAIETVAKLNTDRKRATPEDIHLQDVAVPKTGLLRSSSITVDNGIVNNGAPPGPASIEELARALRYHPDLIYQYVRNNIEIDPVRGVHKGALGAILDNQGSAADQAQLMVSLLRTRVTTPVS